MIQNVKGFLWLLIKNSGTLSQKYFHSYFQLIINTQNCSVVVAKDIIFDRVFDGDIHKIGNIPYHNFMEVYHQLIDRTT
ncbi:hypothetical protein WMZ97_20915 [Lentibacillus sp. N15]|uniref:hypothetical protein n=1 Tax=Lentibacillus songyuanensis TaxID=3136161 RepID=UPI0031BA83A4